MAELFAAVESETDAISAPMVLFCLKCNVIVGDSYSLLKINGEMNTITFTGASNVSRSADVYTSKSGADVGSTYFRFNCSSCQAALGRYYLTTSKDLDDLREKFTFTVDSLGSYELGKAHHGKAPEFLVFDSVLPDMAVTAPAVEGAGAEGSVGVGPGPNRDMKMLAEELDKTMLVMMALLERMDQQEEATQRLSQHVSALVGAGAQPQDPPSQPRAEKRNIDDGSNSGFPRSSESNKRPTRS
jgi:hypothetical protein